MSALLSVPTLELMRLWGELVEAYHGVHRSGSTEAELYAYRLMPYNPLAHGDTGEGFRATEMCQAAIREMHSQAARALVALCEQFAADYQCRVMINGYVPQMWWETGGGDQFGHRAHVEVQH